MRALRFTHGAIHADDMAASVEWLVLGDQQLHLFRRDTPAPQFHHLGLEVHDFDDGSVQRYLRDPAGNLVEVNRPDAGTLDGTAVTEIHRLADERPQRPEALHARLFQRPTDSR